MPNPTDEDIKRIRADVIEKIVRSGANEDTVDVSIEIDAQKNILRAIATGATELRQKNLGAAELSHEEMGKIAADSLVLIPKQSIIFALLDGGIFLRDPLKERCWLVSLSAKSAG